MTPDSSFYLFNLTDSSLDFILSLSEYSIDKYINELIERFYPEAQEEKKDELYKAYKGSFMLEKYIRSSPEIHNSFTAIYTKTGLIREVVNDMYSIGSEKLAIN